MNGESREKRSEAGTGTAPHPVLKKYYERESDRRPFVSALFDNGAAYYDWICGLGSMGSGRFYRRWILTKYGLRAGMKLLDVATGTGLVARAATRILREPGAVVGLDPSIGMLRQAQKSLAIPLVQGIVEELPFATDHFDFLSMGYALRHVSDLAATFREYLRVLKPGGRVCVLEITRPRGRVSLGLLRVYMGWLIPGLTRLAGRREKSKQLWSYYWDTIEHCVPPERILDAMHAAGFTDVDRHVELGIFSAYTATRLAST